MGCDPQNGMNRRHRIEATIEAEHVFVEVGLQVLWLDTTMMRALDPSLQIAEDEVNHWQMRFGLVWIAAERQHVVEVSGFGKSRIPRPSVCAHDRVGRDILFDKAVESLGAPVGYDAKAQPSRIDAPSVLLALVCPRPNLYSADDNSFVMRTATLPSRLAADQAFVNFDRMLAANGIALWSDHASAELVKDLESRLVAGERELALELNGGLSWDLRGHQVRAPKPRRERCVARLHDGSGRQRRVRFAATATKHHRRASRETVRLANNAAFLARKSVRPTDGFKIPSASRVVGEYPLKFRKRNWEAANVHA
jgi:hypothetical protein